jgi:hypothetical protein
MLWPTQTRAFHFDRSFAMCDPSVLRNWLIACLAGIALAVATIVGAAIANGSYWYTYLSPIGMLVAAAFTGAAIGACAMALSALDAFCTCAGPRCSGQCNNLRTTLKAAMTVLGIQATACLTVAAYAWIPGAAQAAQWIIIGALVILTALIISAIAFLSSLTSCATTFRPAPPPVGAGGAGAAPTG